MCGVDKTGKVTPETRRKPTASHFFKEPLEHCATRAWHLLLLGNLCSPMSRAKMEATMERPPMKRATRRLRGLTGLVDSNPYGPI